MTGSSFNLIVAGCVLVLLTGCGGPLIMVKEGAVQADLSKDQYECKIQTERGPYAMAYARDPLANLHYPSKARQEMVACLQHKGWQVQQ